MAKSRHHIKDEYLLMPYGSLTTSNHRFVPEMISNQDGDEILGVAVFPEDNVINPALVGAKGKILRRSNGIYVHQIEFLTKMDPKGKTVNVPQGEVIKRLLEQGMAPKPLFTGNVNKKLRIVLDCKVHGFYIGPSQNLKASQIGAE